MAYTDNDYAPINLISEAFFETDFNTDAGEPGFKSGGGRNGFSFGSIAAPWAKDYTGDIGADTTNLPPSMRGLYENSAPSFEAIDSAYKANLENGMSHSNIMTLFNNQADNDKKFWADGFAKDPNFSQTLYDKSQAMMGTDANQASIAAHQKNIGALAASRGAFTTPTLGPTAGSVSAPRATNTVWSSPGRSNSSAAASQRAASIARQNKAAIASRPTTQAAQYSNFGRFR